MTVKLDLHPFGPTFKEWRLKRGYSLKEAAGDIVSPQFLSQFEKGQKGISIENFSRLLISIGVDFVDFFDIYPGEKLTSYVLKVMDLSDGSVHFEQVLPKVQEAINDFYQDNPLLKKQILLLFKLVIRAKSGNFTGLEREIQQFIQHVQNVETFNLIEIDIINSITAILPYHLVDKLTPVLLKSYHSASDINLRANYHNNLLFLIDYFVEKELYLRAQSIIDEMKQSPFPHQYRLAYDRISLEIEEIWLLLKQNKTEAIPKARKVVDFLRLMKEIETIPGYYHTALPNFLTKFHTLNKTDQDLFSID